MILKAFLVHVSKKMVFFFCFFEKIDEIKTQSSSMADVLQRLKDLEWQTKNLKDFIV
ncbi:hypothetical protein V7068_19110 [Bacillus sp. JJ634]